ncbi:hypothetical protein MNEG_5483 [Monoraphidium neglectum]|uniref:Uncharacterized protein n=1 Tax=Monoraphidium neglectum TaxID=145388 RepID=A0A0D2JUB3_9CHLO|nr:hypothetical protein MNEG_5483 [Monoraphidium neglectum]KIZ02478.1 hypothetical protein MNEG_5483 [Monoraphidium neglectum]|eukprot:XP_013901497.1 hypothetical protein MNEG_5483 [Monoraphidium neglectum]
MPRIKANRSVGAELVVSPWIKKKGAKLAPGDEIRSVDGQRMWSVTPQDLLHPPDPPASMAAAPILAPPGLIPQLQPAPVNPGVWHSRRRAQHSEQAQERQQQHPKSATAQLGAPHPNGRAPATSGGTRPPSDATTSGSGDDWDDIESASLQEAPVAAAAAAGGERLVGVARLALLPSGDLSGHLVTQDSSGDGSGGGRSTCFGLVGRQVLAQHSCYRDTEWGLLRLSIIRFADKAAAGARASAGGGASSSSGRSSAGSSDGGEESEEENDRRASPGAGGEAKGGEFEAEAEAVAWVQRSGGDLVRLEPADFDDEDTAAVLAADGLGDDSDGFTVSFPAASFSGATLLADAAADAALASFAPRLVGRGAVVNIGRMRITGLPLGFSRGGAGTCGSQRRRRGRKRRRGAGGHAGGGTAGPEEPLGVVAGDALGAEPQGDELW